MNLRRQLADNRIIIVSDLNMSGISQWRVFIDGEFELIVFDFHLLDVVLSIDEVIKDLGFL